MRIRLLRVHVSFRKLPCGGSSTGHCKLGICFIVLVAEWIHFTLFGIILPTIKLKVYTFGGL